MDHKLQALRSVRKVGPAQEPCYAVCTCGWQTESGSYDPVRTAFFTHCGQAVKFPPRQP